MRVGGGGLLLIPQLACPRRVRREALGLRSMIERRFSSRFIRLLRPRNRGTGPRAARIAPTLGAIASHAPAQPEPPSTGPRGLEGLSASRATSQRPSCLEGHFPVVRQDERLEGHFPVVRQDERLRVLLCQPVLRPHRPRSSGSSCCGRYCSCSCCRRRVRRCLLLRGARELLQWQARHRGRARNW